MLLQSKKAAKESRWRGDKMTWPQRGELIPSLRGTSSHVACMAERVASGLRPNGEAMRLPAYLYGL